MSSIEDINWLRNLQEDVDNIVRVTTTFVLQRVAKRTFKRLQESRKKRRSCWVKPWLLRRHQLGAYDGLMVELANEDVEGYISFQRLAPDLFGELLAQVGPLIKKKDTPMRPAISPGARLALTLRYLATGIKLLYFTNHLFVHICKNVIF